MYYFPKNFFINRGCNYDREENIQKTERNKHIIKMTNHRLITIARNKLSTAKRNVEHHVRTQHEHVTDRPPKNNRME